MYVDERGKNIRDKAVLARIRSLGISPAYTDVWICPFVHGHIQATGRDARGRKQYVYHAAWIAERDATKFHRLLVFADRLSSLRRRVNGDLRVPGMPKKKVVAAIVKLLDVSYERIGNDAYARENGSFGLTTLRNRHVRQSGMTMRLVFRGKRGIVREVPLTDSRLRKIVLACHDLPGHELFAYVDDEGNVRDVKSDDVNEYLHEVTGEEITAKDFRTWHATVLAATSLLQSGPMQKKQELRRRLSTAVQCAARALGNTPSICRTCYIHPLVFSLYEAGKLAKLPGTSTLKKTHPLLTQYERVVVQLLAKWG